MITTCLTDTLHPVPFTTMTTSKPFVVDGDASTKFAIMYMCHLASSAEVDVQKQMLLEAISAGAMHAAQELSKKMEDSWFASFVDKTVAKEAFQNWDVTHLCVATGIHRLPILPCSYIKHVLQPIPRSLKQIVFLHRALHFLVSSWHLHCIKLDDSKIRATPLYALLRWLFKTAPTEWMAVDREERSKRLAERLELRHPKKQLVEYISNADLPCEVKDSVWSMQLAPTYAIVEDAAFVNVPKTGRVSTIPFIGNALGHLSSNVCSKIQHLEQLNATLSAASVYEQVSLRSNIQGSTQFDPEPIKAVPILQLISHGTRDVRLVRSVVGWMDAMTATSDPILKASATASRLGFPDLWCVREMQRSFVDVTNHTALRHRATQQQLQELASYWYSSIWNRVNRCHDPDDPSYANSRSGSGMTWFDLQEKLIGVWSERGVITDLSASSETANAFKELFKKSHAYPNKYTEADVLPFHIVILWRIIRNGIEDSNPALIDLGIETIKTYTPASQPYPLFHFLITSYEKRQMEEQDANKKKASILCTCVRTCPCSVHALLNFYKDWTNEARAQALCMSIFMDSDELVEMLLDTFTSGSMPLLLPRFLKSQFEEALKDKMPGFLPWIMETAPQHLPAILEKGGEWGRKEYEDLLRKCDPNKTETIQVAEWLMMPPRSLDPLPDKPWLKWLNERLYAPGGPAFAVLSGQHADMDGSQHEEKLGQPFVSDSSLSLPVKRSRSH